MAQDSDVARVAAALKAPGLRYRSFGNEPVRAPRVDVSNVTDAYPLLGAAMEAAADDIASPELAAPAAEPTPPEPPFVEPAPPVVAAYVPPPEPEPVAAPEPYTPPAYTPPPMPEPAPVPPLFAQALSQPVAPAAPAAQPAPPAASPAYSLLEALGRQSDLGPSMSASASMPASASYGQPGAAPAPGGTFGSLLAAGGASPGGYSAPASWGNAPGTALRSTSLLPAAAVTIPLSEVLRLVAVGAPAPSSPFDAFRAAVRAPGSR